LFSFQEFQQSGFEINTWTTEKPDSDYVGDDDSEVEDMNTSSLDFQETTAGDLEFEFMNRDGNPNHSAAAQNQSQVKIVIIP